MPEYNFLPTHEVLKDYEDRLARYAIQPERLPLSRRLLRFMEKIWTWIW